MFEVAQTLLLQLIDTIPYVVAIYMVFDLGGSLLLGKR